MRRTITRPVAADAEDHLAASDADFAACEAAGALLFLGAHGLSYGLPAALDGHLSAGRPAVVNRSRKVLPQMAGRFPGLPSSR
ncbi:MAG: hypothetical protein HPM95_00625 [Alphaproteobacteria bacterium]|nr:hypothetical protein [Alphaproteobacteria bacterium]